MVEVDTYTYIHTYIHPYILTYINTSLHIYIYTYGTYIHTYENIHTYIHTYIYRPLPGIADPHSLAMAKLRFFSYRNLSLFAFVKNKNE